MTGRYNTGLTAAEDLQFNDWASRQRAQTQRDPLMDMRDYDMQGWWKKNGGMNAPDLKDVANLPDEFMKPNHLTFSDESKYHGVDGHFGGHWEGNEFEPGAANLQFHGDAGLQQYFKEVHEPVGNKLAPIPQFDERQMAPGMTLAAAGVRLRNDLSGVPPSQNIEERRGRMNMLQQFIQTRAGGLANALGTVATAGVKAQTTMGKQLGSSDIGPLGSRMKQERQLINLGLKHISDERRAAWNKWVETGEGEPPWGMGR